MEMVCSKFCKRWGTSRPRVSQAATVDDFGRRRAADIRGRTRCPTATWTATARRTCCAPAAAVSSNH